MSTLEPNYDWLQANSLEAAPQLLGWELVSHTGGEDTAGRIVEVEAYQGASDPASHAYRGRTVRTAPMFEPGGTLYVYFIYGLHTSVNIVTGRAGEASAVLIRALEPTTGTATMARRRGTSDLLKLTSGPAKLAQALDIGLNLSGTRLGETLDLRPTTAPVSKADIVTAPRVGITRATDHPWRFYLRNNRFVSGR